MTATTIRVGQDVKRELDRFQGLFQAETGHRITHSQLLLRLLRLSQRHQAELLNENEPEWRPPNAAEIARLQATVEDWGVKTDSSRVDDV